MFFQQVFEPKLAQYAYVIGCQKSGEAIVIDPMRDIDTYTAIAESNGLKIIAAADTHIHADYLSGLREFAELGVKIYASDEGDADWKYNWLTGSAYTYQLLKDGDVITLGNIRLKAVHSPGHTPEHISYLVTDGAAADEPMGMLSGDFIFVGDVGRPDLLETAAGMQGVMEGSAKVLYKSLDRFKSLPAWMQVWPGHGAGSACGKALGAVPDSTVGYELKFNASIKASTDEKTFVDFILDGQPEPPMYFARMKRDNRDGQAVLGSLPVPKHMTVAALAKAGSETGSVIVDTRDKSAFASAHLHGSLHAEMNKQFNTIAGSYITEEKTIYLVVAEDKVEEAVRDLIRIGLDHIAGYTTIEELNDFIVAGGTVDSLNRVTFADVESALESAYVLDVRKATEYAEGHIPHAANIAHTRLLARIDEVPTDTPVYIHCRSGARASAAASLLRSRGLEVVYIDDLFDNYAKTSV